VFCGSFKLWRPDGSLLPHDHTPMARAVLEGVGARNEEVVIERPDGSRVAVIVNIDPIFDDLGRLVGAINVFHEATTLAHIAEARARLAAIVDSSDDAIISIDLEATVRSWNKGAERLFGYGPADIVGRPVTMLMPQDRHAEERAILERIRRGERIEHYETVRVRKDGTRIDVSLAVSPIVNDDGAVVGASKIARDITERNRDRARLLLDKEAMSKLYEIGRMCAQSEAEAPEILSAVLDTAIWVTSADKGNVQLYDEDSKTLSIAAQRGFSRAFLEFFAEVDASEASACSGALASGKRVEVRDVENSPIFRDAASLRVMLQAGARAVQSTPLVSSTGTVLGMVSTHFAAPRELNERERRLLDLLARQAADYIERKRGEQQRSELLEIAERARREAETANRNKDEFLAMLGHELRNPLSAIRNAIAAATLDETQRTRALEIAHRQTAQLATIVDDLLDVARITRGRVRLRKAPLSLEELLQKTVDGAEPLMQERGHSLTLRLPDKPIHLEADAARLEQAIVNLLSNSAKYTDPGGVVEVSAEQLDDRVAIRVRDNGIGIARDMLPQIFDLFAQETPALDRKQGGLGIGLTLVRRIVELHGGSVEAKSEGRGTGTEVVITLPTLPAAAMEPAAPKSQSVHPVPLAGRVRVLMVEDNPDAAESLLMILELLGHHVRVVHNALAALEAARANVPDVMLIDIGLPGMNGYDLAKAIRADASLHRVVLVALTGYGGEEDKARAVVAGFDYHLVKPVDIDALGNLVLRAGAAQPGPGTRSAEALH
jgi:PAS domain S-box-containing protein